VTLLPKQNSVAEENGELIRTMNQQVGTCFITIMDAVHSLFASLDPSKVKPAFVHHLFYMYWSYQTNFTGFDD
jgi:hypothetical protein